MGSGHDDETESVFQRPRRKKDLRFRDIASINVKEAVHSFATDIGRKCTWYAISKVDTIYNVKSAILELISKSYPKVTRPDVR